MTSEQPPGDEEGPQEVLWSVDDPEGTWWDDVWPFRDDSVAADEAGEDESAAPVSAGVATELAEPEAPSPFESAAEPPWWRRRFVWVGALVAAGVVVAGLLVLGRGHDGGGEARLLESPTYASPVALSPDTSYVRTRVLPSGALVVTQWFSFRLAADSVLVALPPTPGVDPSAVRVRHVVLAVDGSRFPAAGSLSVAHGSRTLFFPQAHAVYLRYRLSGTVQQTGPGSRALARLTSLHVTTGSDALPTTQVVTGARVLALACTRGESDAEPTSGPVPCGSLSAGDGRVRLAAGPPTRVMAQVELP